MELVSEQMARIVCLGEAMVELSQESDGWALGYGGDTLNTAIHLARSGHDVAYLTALGTDPYSARLREAWTREGLNCSFVLTHPSRQVGLYAITTDASGERNFTYWRETSAAREMFTIPEMERAITKAAHADLLVFSLVSLAILTNPGRETLLSLAGSVREHGGKVAFDGNYRARLWDSVETARHWRDAAIAMANFGLPTLDDEILVSGETTADAVAAHWRRHGCEETIVKLGAAGCRLPYGEIIAPEEVLDPVDTSGAGDAFNAGYLGARLNGATAAGAARAGHALAGWTIMRSGAIPSKESLSASPGATTVY